MMPTLEEPLVPIRPHVHAAPKPPKSFLERTGAVLLVTKPTSYIRSLVGLACNVALAVAGPLWIMWEAGLIGGNWEGIGGPAVVLALLPTVAAVVRQWLGRSPGDMDGGKIRDAIRGK